MTKSFTLRGILMLMLLAVSLQTAMTQSFWTETFSDKTTAQANWIHSGTNGGPRKWQWTNNPQAGNYGPGVFGAVTATTGYMYFDSDSNGNVAHDVRLTGTGAIANCSGKSNVHLKFFTYFRTASGTDVARVGISTDGTNFTYHNVPQFDALVAETANNPQIFQGNIDIKIPEADGQAQVWVQFRYEGTYEYYWKVDDLEMYEEAAAVPCDQNPSKIICDNMETYNTGLISPQAAHWRPWSGNDADVLGGDVSTEQASDGTKSMKIKPDNAPNGDDQLLLLGNKSTGSYSLKWMLYVGTGNGAYFNIQNSETAGQQFNGEFYLYPDGTGAAIIVVNNTPVVVGKCTYTQGQWIPVEMNFDLDNNVAKVYVGGQLLRGWTYPGNIGGIDFYSAAAEYTFYVDQVEYIGLPAVTFDVDKCEAAVDITGYFGGTPNVAQTTGLFNNTTATVAATDPLTPGCWLDGFPNVASTLNGSMWYTFTGDGGTYHVETVPCTAASYIDDGDTQVALYTGDCGSFSQVLCNDDLNFAAEGDYRAGFDFQSESGTDYHLLVDGWSDPTSGFVATGEYCIEITRQPDVSCAQASAGTYTVGNDGFVCDGADVADLLTVNGSTVIIPNSGQIYGMGWAVTTTAVAQGVWPPSLAATNQYVGGTRFLQNPIVISFPNVNLQLTSPVILYFTPVVIGNASSSTADPFMENVDTTGACFVTGVSTPFIYLPPLQPLNGTATFVKETIPPGGNGSINLTVGGGFFDFLQDPSAYTVTWTGPNNFTSTEEDPTGLTAGTYVATISDITGCVDPITVTVSVTTPTKDPESVKTLTLQPNPTSNSVLLNLELANAAEVRAEVLNTLGQSMETINAGKVNTLSQSIDLSRYAEGTYFLRVTVDGETAVRRVVLQR
ncbi:MAG: T9SS type A sorting domain-containing protein [Saprospiraceae bacterium]|nr:T9SS type A sorting domain-containing protein [Saprospiraceae bacterium]